MNISFNVTKLSLKLVFSTNGDEQYYSLPIVGFLKFRCDYNAELSPKVLVKVKHFINVEE